MSRPAASNIGLPAAVSEAARFYLRPVGLTCGKAADKLANSGKARRLAGGPWFFAACEVVLRAPPHETRRTTAALEDIEAWADRLPTEHRDRLRAQLERLVTPRLAPGLTPLARPLMMGIVDVASEGFDPEAAVAHGRWLAAAGADLIEIAGATAQHAADIAPADETERILSVVRGLADLAGLAISVDTRHAEAAAKALATGATMISDGALPPGDAQSLSATTLVHTRVWGLPGALDPAPDRNDLVFEVFDRLEARVEAILSAGIPHAQLVVDPGVDCHGNDGDNTAILNQLALFHSLGCTLLLGLPADGETGDHDRKAVLHALDQGAQILRTHDVTEVRRVLDHWERLIASGK